MKLIEFKASPNCLRVRMACRFKNLSYTSIEIDPLDRKEVIKISGQPTVPVLIDGKKVLDDSTTILRYLDKKFPSPPLFPSEGIGAAQTEILVDWSNEVFRKSVWLLFQEAFKKKEERNLKKIREIGKTYAFHLRLLEKWLCDGRAYLIGSFPTAADFSIYPFVTYAVLPEKLKNHPLYELHYSTLRLPSQLPFLKNWLTRFEKLSDWEIQ